MSEWENSFGKNNEVQRYKEKLIKIIMEELKEVKENEKK